MMTTLFSVSFTSCIDNEVSPLVEAIYEGQADLIAAQAAVQNAEAALRTAQANAAQAQADYTDAQTAQVEALTDGIIADNAHQAALREQELRLLVAQTNLGVSEAENALAIAEEEFKIEMAELMAELEEAGVQLAIEYAYKYRNAMYAANNILSEKLQADEDLADAQLMLVDAEDMTYEYHLAQLQNEVTMYTAQVAYITDWLALLNADATDPLSVMETLKVQIADLEAQEDAIDILAQEQYNKVMAIYDQADNRDDALYRIMDSLDEHNDAVEEKNDREEWIATAQENIVTYQTAIDDYDTVTADLQAIVDAAQIAYDAAVAAEAIAEAASDAADTEASEKLAELNQIIADIANLYANLQTAIDTLAALEAGEAPLLADKAAADAALLAAQGAEAIVQARYDLRKANFEANPAGITWLDGTDTPPMFETPLVGDHNDALATSYVEVLTWDNNGVDDNTPATWNTVTSATYPADGGGQTYVVYSGAITDAQAVDANYHVFLEVEADDTSDTNANLLNIEVAALDAAKVVTANAQTAVDDAQDALDTYADDLLAAQEDYEYKKGLYEDGVAIQDAAQIASDAAAAAAVTAQDTEDDAETLVADTDADLTDAEANLTAHEGTTAEDYQDMIDDANDDIAEWNAEIANIQPIIDAKYAVVAGLFPTLDNLGVEYTFEVDEDGLGTIVVTNFGELSNLYSDLHAAIIAEWQAYWDLELQDEMLEDQQDYLEDLLEEYEDQYENLFEDIVDFEEDLAIAQDDLEEAKAALALATNDKNAAVAYITYLEAKIANLEVRYANALAIAAQYKALMDAAIAS